MEEAVFRARLDEELARCEENAARTIDDAFEGTIWASRRDMTAQFVRQLAEGEAPASLCARMREKLPELREACEREIDHPSFDWYDEHYHYKVLKGECEACEALLKIEAGAV